MKYLQAILLLLVQLNTFAAAIIWTNASSDGNWNTATNWSTNTIPGAADIAIFDATSIDNCSLNSAINVAGFHIDAGYVGVVSQLAGNSITIGNSNFSLADGSFIGGNSTFTCNSDFILNSGSFTSTINELILKKDISYNGGVFIHNNGTVKLGGNNKSISGSPSFYNLTIALNWGGGTLTFNDDINIDNAFLLSGTQVTTINGPGVINCFGDIDLQNTSSGFSGIGTINITGVSNQNVISTVNHSQSDLPNVIINKTGGTVFFGGIVSVYKDWTYTAGNVDYVTHNANIEFTGSNQNVYGAQSFEDITLNMQWGGGSWTVNDDIDVDGAFTVRGSQPTHIQSANVFNIKGDINLNNTSGAFYGAATLTITGNANQNITSTVGYSKSDLPNVIINKSGGTAFFSGIVSVSRDWTYISGNVDYITNNAILAFTGGVHEINGVQDFGKVSFNLAWGGGELNINDDITILTDLSILGSQPTKINGPAVVHCHGNLTLSNTSSGGGNGTISISGNSNNLIKSTVPIRKSIVPNVIINKTGGIATFEGVVSIGGDWTYTAGNTDYVTNNSTIAFVGANQNVNGVQDFHNVSLSFTWGGGSWLVNDDITLSGDLSLLGGQKIAINGPGIVNCEGGINLNNTHWDGGYGNGTINISGANNQNIVSTVARSRSDLPNVIINKTGGIATFGGFISLTKDWTYLAGNTDYATNNATVVFSGVNQSVNGVQDLHNVLLFHYTTSTWTVNDDVTIENDFSVGGNNKTTINGPAIVNCTGDIHLDNTHWQGGYGNGTVNITGVNNQNIVSSVARSKSDLPNVIINKAGGVATFSGFISLTKDWTYLAGNTDYATNNATVVFSGQNQSVNGVQNFHNLLLFHYTTSTWTVNDDITIENDFSVGGSNQTTINGPAIVNCVGDIHLDNTHWQGGYGNGTINITGANNQNIVSTVTKSKCDLPNVIINKTGGLATFTGVISLTKDWTYLAGNTDYSTNNATVVFTGQNQSVNGVQNFYNVLLFHYTTSTWTVNDDITITNDFSVGGNNRTSINGAAIVNCTGDIHLDNSHWDGGYGDGTVKITGTSNQSIVSTRPAWQCDLPNLIIDKTGGIATFDGNITFTGNFTYEQGNADATVNSTRFLSQGVNTTIDGESASGVEMTFYDLTLNGAIVNQSLEGNIKVNHFLQLYNTRLAMNGNEITLLNPNGNALTTVNNGMAISESADNSSRINWSIGANSDNHIFLFGNAAYTSIPFHFQVTDGGTVGIVSVSTYPTNAANVPYPILPINVTNMINISGNDNSTNTIDRFWQIDKTGEDGEATLAFFYAQVDVSGGVLGNEAMLEAQRYQDIDDHWQPALPGQTQFPGPNYVRVLGVTQFSPWTLALNSSPLPVELIAFDLKKINNQCKLTWETASEINNDYFEIQKSNDGIEFNEIGKVKGAGNSNTYLEYIFFDEIPFEGMNFYRLKQIDFDGKFEFSEVRTVRFDSKGMTIFPNPAKNKFKILNSNVGDRIVIFDLAGKLVFDDQVPLNNIIDVAFLPNGVYAVVIDDIIQKLIIASK